MAAKVFPLLEGPSEGGKQGRIRILSTAGAQCPIVHLGNQKPPLECYGIRRDVSVLFYTSMLTRIDCSINFLLGARLISY